MISSDIFSIRFWRFLIPLLAVFAIAVFAHDSQPRRNSLGVLESYRNTNTYLFALPVDGKVLDGHFTNIRFKPYAAPILYDESILFCGDVTEKFQGKLGPLVVTYRTQASGKYEGVGCHELLSVFQVVAPQEVQ